MEKIICISLYSGEITLEESVSSIKRQTVSLDSHITFSHIYPCRKAMNDVIDHGYNNGYDWVSMVPADVILFPNAFEEFLKCIQKDFYWVAAIGKDAIFGQSGSGMVFINIKAVTNKYRLDLNDPISDMNLKVKMEKETQWRHHRIEKVLTIHHPIWLPWEMYNKVRFHVGKCKVAVAENAIETYRHFFERELERLPDNLTLKIGFDLFKKMIENPDIYPILDDKDVKKLRDDWNLFKKDYPLTGKEFYAMEGWEEKAEELLK